MDEVKKKYNSIDWVSLRRSAGKLKARAASNFKDMVMTDVENAARAATSDTSWGATGMELEMIARATYNREEYPLVMGIVWERLASRKWRNVYKSLELLKYLCLHGSQRCYDEAKDALSHIRALQNFRYVDSFGKDEGRNVRERAKQISDLLSDPDLLAEEREKSKALKAKIGGGSTSAVSSDDYRYGTGPRGGSGTEFDDPYENQGGYGGFSGYEEDGYNPNASAHEAEHGAGPVEAAEGAASSAQAANTGLDDLLGLGDAQGSARPPIIHEPHDEPEEEEDLFNPRALPPAPSKAPLDTFGDDVFAALPRSSAAPAPSSFGGSGDLDLFALGGTSMSAVPSAGPQSASDPFGPARAATTTDSAESGIGAYGGFAPSGTAVAPKPPLSKKQDLDIFGDLVNFNNMGQVSRQERHDVHTGGSLNSLAADSSKTQTGSTSGSQSSATKATDHDALFGL